MGFGGILAGAMGGAAEGVGQSAQEQMRTNQLVDIEKQISSIREEKDKRIAEHTAKLGYDYDVKRTDPNGTLFANRLEGAKQEGLLKGVVDRSNASALGKDSGALAGIAAEAKAKYVASPESVAQAALINQRIANDKVITGLQGDLAAASDPAARQAIQQKIRDRTYTLESEGHSINNSVNSMKLENVQQVTALQKEWKAADPKRREEIKSEIEILTGKDNDSFMPVPIKDSLGNTTGYQIFDKKSGRWVNTGMDTNDPLGINKKPVDGKAQPTSNQSAKPETPKADAAPAPQVSLTDQLTEKLKKSTNDPQAFSVLAYEANNALPKIMEQISSIQQSLESLPASAASERSAMQKRMDDLVRARQIYEGVVSQSKARDTSPVRQPR